MNLEQKEILFSKKMLDVVNKKYEASKEPSDTWAPTDFLPDFKNSNWDREVKQLQDNSLQLSDHFFMALAGNMITEEGLPTFLTWINQNDHIGDRSGVDTHPWAKWARAWTAEENKHGDLLHKYLFLSGRVDMRAIEVTIGEFIRGGFTTKSLNDPYKGMVYTSFQERATRISHSRLSQEAKKAGDNSLAKMCQIIAADEGRHEAVYQSFVQEIFNQRPSEMMIAFGDMIKTGITMPLGSTGEDNFQFFSKVTEALGMYTYGDYIDILDYLLKKWSVEKIDGLNEEAKKAQDYVCSLPSRLRRIAERKAPPTLDNIDRPLLWVHEREEVILNNQHKNLQTTLEGSF